MRIRMIARLAAVATPAMTAGCGGDTRAPTVPLAGRIP